MNNIFLAMIVLCSFLFSGCDNATNNKTNTWYAGTQYTGTVNTGQLAWECSGGTCVLKGKHGDGLNMTVCQELSKKVGGLDYYYNDSGMTWSKTQNHALLDQCNILNSKSNEQADTPIRQTEGKSATYPEALKEAGQQGHAIVKFVVNEQGHVKNPVVIEETHPEFGEAMIEAILKSQFQPALQQGKPIEAERSESCLFMLPSFREQFVNEIKKFPAEFQYDLDKDAMTANFVYCKAKPQQEQRK